MTSGFKNRIGLLISALIFSLLTQTARGGYSEGSFDFPVDLLGGYTWIGIWIDITGSPPGATVTGVDVHFEISPDSGLLYVRLGDENSHPSDAYVLMDGVDTGGEHVSETYTDISGLNGKPVDQKWILWVAEYYATEIGQVDSWWIRVYYDDVEPYLIATAEDMNSIGAHPEDWDKHFKLMADIDLSSYTGTDFNIIGNDVTPFTGVFDGNGHTISNFNYVSGSMDYVGLFGYVDSADAEVKDLRLVYPNVDAGSGNYVGCLVGCLADGTVSNCHIETGDVVGGQYVGLLVGKTGGSLSSSSARGTVNGYQCVGVLAGLSDGGTINQCCSSGSVYGGDNLGGLLGYNWFGTVTNCYSQASVDGGQVMGGLVGYHRGGIYSCYSMGKIIGDDYVGGLVGYMSAGEVIASFWDIETSEIADSNGGEDKTTAEMQTLNTFTDAGWDFVGETTNGTDDIWDICEGTNYPKLAWAIPPAGDFICPDGVNFIDFAVLGSAWMSEPDEDNWNPLCDISDPNDDIINLKDLNIFIEDWLAGI